MEIGKWKVESGKWEVGSGKWKGEKLHHVKLKSEPTDCCGQIRLWSIKLQSGVFLLAVTNCFPPSSKERKHKTRTDQKCKGLCVIDWFLSTQVSCTEIAFEKIRDSLIDIQAFVIKKRSIAKNSNQKINGNKMSIK